MCWKVCLHDLTTTIIRDSLMESWPLLHCNLIIFDQFVAMKKYFRNHHGKLSAYFCKLSGRHSYFAFWKVDVIFRCVELQIFLSSKILSIKLYLLIISFRKIQQIQDRKIFWKRCERRWRCGAIKLQKHRKLFQSESANKRLQGTS